MLEQDWKLKNRQGNEHLNAGNTSDHVKDGYIMGYDDWVQT